ncbi:unnamed protein product [Caenorhabditis angaria]|uniref:6-phosphofructokinase n=1 Tax=Caenorhabditis angaria TaxID=860376 RepID=A0A9P1MZW6_9PELO|nr:unnamed protein product [Caenorhabditis angaria]
MSTKQTSSKMDKIVNQVSVGVMTSGGDSPGMNSAIRAVVRETLRRNYRCYLIREGYAGLISGKIDEANWSSVANITHIGGSFIGTSRCDEFRTYDGRKKAAKQMYERQMFNLVVIGGDGSLTGAQKLKEDWMKIGEELFAEGNIKLDVANKGRELRLVGIVGSIDNDCIETDKSIGSDSALHRICESIDGLVMTAQSHQRIFVIEVMGRHCGYLALTSGIAVEADFVFYPEMSLEENWADKLCQQLETVRKLGKRHNIIIIGEGCKNAKGEKFDAKLVKSEIENRMTAEVRTVSLGHLQRGGTPTFLDRLLGLRMGYNAVKELLRVDKDGKPFTGSQNNASVICLRGHTIKQQSLDKVLRKVEQANDEIKHGNVEKATKLRGTGFLDKTEFVAVVSNPLKTEMSSKSKVFAVIHVGLPVAGMNAITFAFTRMANQQNIEIVGIQGAWDGLKNNGVIPLTWKSVEGWAQEGGSLLGAKRQLPSELDQIAQGLNDHNIDGLLIVGGFTAFVSALIMHKNRSEYSSFNIPIVVVPATVSNNCPGTCASIGADTALNEICRQVDNIRQSAIGSKNKVMIIETMGKRSGYLASMVALATGSDYAITYQNVMDKDQVSQLAKKVKTKLEAGKIDKYLIIKSEDTIENVSSASMKSIFEQEFGEKFSVRITNLGYSQFGGHPTCFDRQMGIRMGIRAFEALFNPKKMGKRDCCVIGLRGSRLKYVPVCGLEKKVCMNHFLPLKMWWIETHSLIERLTWKPEDMEEKTITTS